MAPELIRSDPHSRRPAADVYSYGVVLYELISGQRPWAGVKSTAEVIAGVGWGGQRVELPAGLPSVCPLLRGLMERCLATVPKERPTFREIVSIIEGAQPVSFSTEPVPGGADVGAPVLSSVLPLAVGPLRLRAMANIEGAPVPISTELAPGETLPAVRGRRRLPPLLPASARAHLRSGGGSRG